MSLAPDVAQQLYAAIPTERLRDAGLDVFTLLEFPGH